jgi:hypothetical protein
MADKQERALADNEGEWVSGLTGGVQIRLAYDLTPLPLTEPDPLYSHRYQAIRVHAQNAASTPKVLRIYGVRKQGASVFSMPIPGGIDEERGLPRNRYYFLDGPEGMSPPEFEVVDP